MPDETRNEELNEELEASTRKWMVAGLVLMALFLLAFPVYRLYEPSRRAEAREDQLAFLAAEGMDLFEANCSECHGPAGSGAIAPAIGSSEFLASVTNEQISQLTSLGIPGTEMVAYSNDFGGPMTQSQIDSITTYLRSLEEEAPSIATWRTPLVDSGYSSAQLFGLACSRCHGVNAEGIEDSGPDISPDSLTMMESDEWIAGRIAQGYKDMPRFGTALSERQILDLVTWLRYGAAGPPATTTTTTTTMPGNGQGNGNGNGGTSTTTTTTLADGVVDPDVLALGEALYNTEFGFDGCQECHALDLGGTVNAPSIIGASRSAITRALAGVPDMEVDTPLTPEEVEALYVYITWLTENR